MDNLTVFRKMLEEDFSAGDFEKLWNDVIDEEVKNKIISTREAERIDAIKNKKSEVTKLWQEIFLL